MEIVVTGRHMQVSDRFRDHLDEKLAKIPQLAPRVQRVDVIVSHESNKRQAKACERVEITCHVKGPIVRAEACLDDKYAALDVALDMPGHGDSEGADYEGVDLRRWHTQMLAQASAGLAELPKIQEALVAGGGLTPCSPISK